MFYLLECLIQILICIIFVGIFINLVYSVCEYFAGNSLKNEKHKIGLKPVIISRKKNIYFMHHNINFNGVFDIRNAVKIKKKVI